MIWLFVSIIGGVLTGYLLRYNQNVPQITDKLMSVVIWLLLFFLGISIGRNSEIVAAFKSIGISGAILGISTIIGSIVVCIAMIKGVAFEVIQDE